MSRRDLLTGRLLEARTPSPRSRGSKIAKNGFSFFLLHSNGWLVVFRLYLEGRGLTDTYDMEANKVLKFLLELLLIDFLSNKSLSLLSYLYTSTLVCI